MKINISSIGLCILSCIALFFTSCTFTMPEIGKFNIKNVEKGEKEGEFIVNVGFYVENPNTFNIRLSKADFDVFLEGQKLGKAKNQKKIILKKKTNDEYILSLKTNASDAFSSILGGLMGMLGKGGAMLEIKGSIKAGVFIFSKKFPVEHSEKLSMQELQGLLGF